MSAALLPPRRGPPRAGSPDFVKVVSMAAAGHDGHRSRIGVFGLGNVLIGRRSAVGLTWWRCSRLLRVPRRRRRSRPRTPGSTDALRAGMDALVLVDAVKAQGPRERCASGVRDEILRTPPAQRPSPHDRWLKEARYRGGHGAGAHTRSCWWASSPTRPRPASGSPGRSRSRRMGGVAVLIEMERLGAPGRPRERPRRRNLWWRRPRPDEPAEGRGPGGRNGVLETSVPVDGAPTRVPWRGRTTRVFRRVPEGTVSFAENLFRRNHVEGGRPWLVPCRRDRAGCPPTGEEPDRLPLALADEHRILA